MELIIQILMLFVVINTVLKLSFWKWWQAALFSFACGVFVIVSCQWAVLQSKTQLADYLTKRTILQDAAVLITIESVICIVFCFARLQYGQASKPRWWLSILNCYPNLLIFPVLFYLLTQLIYAMPGIDFSTISYLLAGAAFILLPLLGFGMKYLYPENDLRLEIHFLVSLFVCVIGLISTVNGNVAYTAAKEPLNIKAIILSLGLFLSLFLSGIAWNKLKWNIFNKRPTNIN